VVVVLDVVFGEDANCVRNGHGTENFGLLRKFTPTGWRKRVTASEGDEVG
jgi:hypothetical protein